MFNIQIILGSTREGRAGEKVANWVIKELREFKEIHTELLDLKDYPMPFYGEVLPVETLHHHYKAENAEKWVNKVKEADGYIIITPEYNHGYSAVLKNALDYAYEEWNKKPVAFISYGGVAGGARAVEQLKQVAVELQMAPLRESVHINKIWEAFDKEDGKLVDQEEHSKKLKTVAEHLIWWTDALKTKREKV